MCLYTALSYPINEVIRTRDALEKYGAEFPDKQVGPYNDLFPAWTVQPTESYREKAAGNQGLWFTAQNEDNKINTDQLVFDPRIWNGDMRRCLEERIRELSPKVVLVSSVSPAHRYAIEIANVIKEIESSILVILGGRHADETIRKNGNGVEYAPSSIVSAMQRGLIKDVVDFVVSGEGYRSLDFLMKCISIAMDIETRTVRRDTVLSIIEQNRRQISELPGRSIITCIRDEAKPVSFVIDGKKTEISDLPLPYESFAIRARFPIFPDGYNKPKLTAHVNTTHACVFRCSFCSEALPVVGQIVGTENREFYQTLIKQYLAYGAKAFFFDDSVLCGANSKKINELLDTLIKIRKEAEEKMRHVPKGTPQYEELERAANLQFGAQLTVDFLTTLNRIDASKDLLKKMREAGCTYIYIGIESLAESVILQVDKNRKNRSVWVERTRMAMKMIKEADIRVGASILFGLPGETRKTIDETIEGIGKIIDDGLLDIASPNIATYHPATKMTSDDGMTDKINYTVPATETKPPYVYFEEAFEGVVSSRLDEDTIWHIHNATEARWSKARNMCKMKLVEPPELNRQKQTFDLAAEKDRFSRGRFYSSIGVRLVEPQNYPPEIVGFLHAEDKKLSGILEQNKYDCIVEVGCMDQGFFLETALRTGIRYVGFDLIEDLAVKLDKRIKQIHPGNAAAYVGDAFEMEALAEKWGTPRGATIASFPFNSFGNMLEPRRVIEAVKNAGMDIAIFTYGTEERHDAVRAQYYKNCKYTNIREVHTPEGTLFHSDDGLWSYAYNDGFVKEILAQNGFEYTSVPFAGIGVLHFGKVNYPRLKPWASGSWVLATGSN